MRYMNIMRLSNEVLNTYGKYPHPDEPGFQQALAIYVLAFEELLRQGMLHEEKGKSL